LRAEFGCKSVQEGRSCKIHIRIINVPFVVIDLPSTRKLFLAQNQCLPGHDLMWFGANLPTFWGGNIPPPSSRLKMGVAAGTSGKLVNL
jgi:hypothetical protein